VKKERLKKDLFGSIWLTSGTAEPAIIRDTRDARWWLRWVARALMRREAGTLAVLAGLEGVPAILKVDSAQLSRTFISGRPLYEARPADADFYRAMMRLLRNIHAAGVAHNDLAKEANILVDQNDQPAFIDFQLAAFSKRRGALFRIAAREDIRHLLKHKRTYRPDLLTAREQRILRTPSLPSRIYHATLKPVYLFVTRRLMGWADREGAADRGRNS